MIYPTLLSCMKYLKEASGSYRASEVTLVIPRTTHEAHVSYYMQNPEIEVNGEKLRALDGVPVRIVEDDILPKDCILKIDHSKIPMTAMELQLPPTELGMDTFFEKQLWNKMIRETRPKLTITCNPALLGIGLYEAARVRYPRHRKRAALRRRASRFLHRSHLLTTRKAKRKAVRAIRKDAKARGIHPTVAEAMEKVSGLRGKRK